MDLTNLSPLDIIVTHKEVGIKKKQTQKKKVKLIIEEDEPEIINEIKLTNSNHETKIDNKKFELVNIAYTIEETDLTKLSKIELLSKYEEFGIKRCKSKNKRELIELITGYNNTENNNDHISKSLTDESKEHVNTNNIINTYTSNETKHLKPLIKWSGGKSDEIKMFEKYFPEHYNRYIEPFVGGGSVYFYLNPINAIISDVHIELIDLYKSIGNGKGQEIYDFMKQSSNDENTYYKVRDEMEINNELDSAKRFYYQRKTCFRGMLRYNKNGKFNIPFGRYKTINYNELINKDYEALLGRTEILNKGFDYIFENYNDKNNFMFLDPPYDSEFTDYGYCQFGKEEQKKLAFFFKNTKIKCLMIIGKTKFIEELYDGYIVSEYDKKYKFKIYGNRIGDEINTKHLIIKNY
jgi:DNA adenine methylase